MTRRHVTPSLTPRQLVLLWDTSADSLRPVLTVGSDKASSRRAVRSVVVLPELQLLATAHANGKVRGCAAAPRVAAAAAAARHASGWHSAREQCGQDQHAHGT